MSIIQNVKGNHTTFSALVHTIFIMVMAEGYHSGRNYAVVNVYREMSIKNVDRLENRGTSEATHFKDISGGHKIEQWRKFLSGQRNKTSLVLFPCNEWKTEKYRTKLNGKNLYIAYKEEYFKVIEAGVQEILSSRRSRHPYGLLCWSCCQGWPQRSVD